MIKRHLLGTMFALVLTSSAHAADVKVINDDAWFAEGPIWYQDKLFYVEYGRGTVDVWDGKKNEIFWKMDGCGPSAVLPTTTGELLVTCYDYIRNPVRRSVKERAKVRMKRDVCSDTRNQVG